MMRAKVYVSSVMKNVTTDKAEEQYEVLTFMPVASGTPEDNNYSKYTPSGSIVLNVTNSALFGKFKAGQKFYVDFTEANQ